MEERLDVGTHRHLFCMEFARSLLRSVGKITRYATYATPFVNRTSTCGLSSGVTADPSSGFSSTTGSASAPAATRVHAPASPLPPQSS